MGTVKLKDFRSAVMALQTNALAKMRDISQGKLHSSYWGAISEQLMESGMLLRVIDANPDADIASLPPSAPVGVEVLRDLRDRVLPAALRHHASGPGYIEEAQEIVGRALAQQPAADGGFAAADMMDARQEGRKEAQGQAEFYRTERNKWQRRAERLEEALRLARDLVGDWAGYAGEYFQKKHNLEGDLALLDAALRDHGKGESNAP